MASRNSLANLDRDNSGEPGGSPPTRYALVERETGAIVVAGSAAIRDTLMIDGAARLATARDLEVGGRADLIDLL